MKSFKTVLNVLAFFAAVAAALYVGMTYGNKILAWIKKILRVDVLGDECCEEVCCCDDTCCCEETVAEVTTEHVEAEDHDFEA